MLIDISASDYYELFRVDPNPFLSNNFIEINQNKVEKIFRLVEATNKPSVGLILGLKNMRLLSPFSAPFGGFHFGHETIYINTIYQYIQQLKKFITDNGFDELQITLPPDIYHQTINAKLIHCLNYEGFELEKLDITSWVDLGAYNNFFNDNKSRNHLNQAINFGLQFRFITQSEEREKVYKLINMNRAKFGRPIHMSFDDLDEVSKIWTVDYFAVYDTQNEMMASSINYIYHQSIVFLVFWGDNEKGRQLRAMDFCIFNLLNYYKHKGYKYMDIGISTEEGIPNEGLLRFKETHEATSSLRYTFKWSNDFSDIKKKMLLNEPISKYGIVLRLVEIADAEFIFRLRNNSDLNKFISYTSPDLKDQIKWIQEYKIREKTGHEYYFIAQDQIGNKYGTIRLYDLDEKSFEIGSWLFNYNSPIGMAVKAHFIGFETGFEVLKAKYCRFEIRKENTAVLRYMQDFETSLVGEDDLNFYFTLSKENFYKRRAQLSIFS